MLIQQGREDFGGQPLPHGQFASTSQKRLTSTFPILLVLWVLSISGVGLAGPRSVAVEVTVTSPLTFPRTPVDPTIDFEKLIEEAGLEGGLDPNSMRVIDLVDENPVPFTITDDFLYSDKGRVEWVIPDPRHRGYRIEFQVVSERSPFHPAEWTPPIGVGDLLRYNAGVPRPITLMYLSGLFDLNGDGSKDLVGSWNYAYRPGDPWDGIVYYPRTSEEGFLFGDLTRVRFVKELSSKELHHFEHTYLYAAFADLNRDGLLDLIESPSGDKEVHCFLNSGRQDKAGTPIFVQDRSIPCSGKGWSPCRVVDLDGDGLLDLVVADAYIRNRNPQGWPFEAEEPVPLDAGKEACFLDLNGDRKLDSICLVEDADQGPRSDRVAWRENLGGVPPRFATPEWIASIDARGCSSLAAVNQDGKPGLLVGHDFSQAVSFYSQKPNQTEEPFFEKVGRAQSISAVLSLSDQAWPCFCDWDADGDLDLLVGGGYGWPRVLMNEGSAEHPRYSEPHRIFSEGKPIRLLRDDILGGKHWHNMGYSYPVFVDWDGDGLRDLMLPNETNRIFWYKNEGTPKEPRFGKRRQVLCEGYPDSPEYRRHSARLASDNQVPNSPYPYEKDRPYFWRTGAAFGDFNGDHLMDMVTSEGLSRNAVLFAQYRDLNGDLKLRKQQALELVDGRVIDDRIVNRQSHWTESFRACDWDGDGLLDLIYSCAGSQGGIQDDGSIFLLRNTGTRNLPVFEPPRTLRCYGEPIRVSNHGPHPWVGDYDGDGLPDLVTCAEWSVYAFYGHAAIETGERVSFELGRLQVQ